MNWYLKVMKEHYADFKGRARRKEYWFFALFNIIIMVIATILDKALGLDFTMGSGQYAVSMGYGYIYIIAALIHLIPGLAVSVRRLHDVGKSGWMYFIVLIPLVGPIWLLVLMFTDSADGENKWGPNPKEVISE